jgi:prepilin-type N-terminal cleavage/methylation domain-containing protein
MFRPKNNKNQKGYTLVELAIVLTIMGVLAGSIVLGREMISDAKVKSLINDFENFKQAHYLYIKRTGYPPGLIRDTNGNFTSDKWGSGLGSVDHRLYFEDLIAEGLISKVDPNDDLTMHSYGGAWLASSISSQYAYIQGEQICAHNVPILVAYQIDIKLDDGTPNTGRVLTGRLPFNALTISYAEESNNTFGAAYVYTVCRAL